MTPRLDAVLVIVGLFVLPVSALGQDRAELDRLPFVDLAPPAAPPHREGRPVRVRPDPELREPRMRVRIELPVVRSVRARDTISRTLTGFFMEATSALADARGATVTCRATLALSNLVSYLCTYSGRFEDQTFDEVGLDTVTFAIDGEYARVIDEREEIGLLPFEDLAAIVCSRLRRHPMDCAGTQVALALDRDGVVVYVPTPGNRSPYFSSRLTFTELAWRVAQYDGVVARIPGATARASSGRRLLAFERPDDIEATARATGVEPAVAYDVLVGEPAPLDLLARRLRDVRGRVRVARRADGLYQIVVPPWDVVRGRALGAALARARCPRELDVLYIEQAELRAARTLRTGPDEDDPVVRTVPSGTRVTTVHGFLGAVFSDRVTNAGTLYVVTEIDAGFGFDWPDALSAVR